MVVFLKLLVTIQYSTKNTLGVNNQQVYILKYPVNISNTSVSQINIGNQSPYNTNGIPNDLTIGQTDFNSSQTIYAFNSIEVSGNLSNTVTNPCPSYWGTSSPYDPSCPCYDANEDCQPSIPTPAYTVVLQAGEGITIDPGVSLVGQITLQVAEPLGCGQPIGPVTDVSNYCAKANTNSSGSASDAGNYLASTPVNSSGARLASASSTIDNTPVPTSALADLSIYPNPFSKTTTIKYTLPSAGSAKLYITDVYGHEVSVLRNGFDSLGDHTISLSSATVSAGVYFVVFESPSGKLMQRMVVLE